MLEERLKDQLWDRVGCERQLGVGGDIADIAGLHRVDSEIEKCCDLGRSTAIDSRAMPQAMLANDQTKQK